MNRWTDPAGHHWPITDHRCTVCNLPLVKVDHHDTHPTCEGEEP